MPKGVYKREPWIEVTCPCGKVFLVKPYIARNGTRKYCSRTCRDAYFIQGATYYPQARQPRDPVWVDGVCVMFTNAKDIAFLIDEGDYERVSTHAWNIGSHGYPTTPSGETLHSFLFGKAPTGFHWDHINRDKLDNRRRNLRVVTPSENQLAWRRDEQRKKVNMICVR